MRLLLSALLISAAGFAADTPSARESSPAGWIDIMPTASMQGWRRVADPKDPVLRETSPWRLEGKTLVCDGAKAGHEYLQYTKPMADFIFHVEWRFLPAAPDARYNSGVIFRQNADGTIWHQAQTGAAGGFLFAQTPVAGESKRVNMRDQMKENRLKPVGEWNTYEITAKGNVSTLWVNGAVTNEMPVEVAEGFLALEAEGFAIEFRNIAVKPLTK